jgi:hypothetical protein
MKIGSKNTWNVIMALIFAVAISACGGDEKVGSENMISGSSSKTWKADKELSASGDKDKLTKAEKRETMQFYSDGRFALGGGSMLQTGTWSFDQSAKRLTLQFENQGVTENFEVLKLTDDHMELKAADGSIMELETE